MKSIWLGSAVLAASLLNGCSHTASGQEAAKVEVSAPAAKAPAKKLAAAAPAKHEMAKKVTAGEKFAVVYYSPKTDKVEVWMDKSQRIGDMAWSNKKKGAHVYSLKLEKKGQRSVDLKTGETWYSVPVEVK